MGPGAKHCGSPLRCLAHEMAVMDAQQGASMVWAWALHDLCEQMAWRHQIDQHNTKGAADRLGPVMASRHFF